MTIARYDFQRQCARNTPGRILNVGCKEDPAHLKANFGPRVVGMDIWEYDIAPYLEDGTLKPIQVDVVHDATQAPWPFEDNQFGLVILGDILEDLPDDGCHLIVLREARRVGKYLCITAPEDSVERDAHHFTTITEARLKGWLQDTRWKLVSLATVDYGVVPRGYFAYARRAEVS